MLNIDPPAIAGGTDVDQVRRTTFAASMNAQHRPTRYRRWY